jgi:hypothetical protein
MPGWRGDQCSSAKRGPGRSESVQHFPSPRPVAYQPRMLASVLFPTLGQGCDGLVVCAPKRMADVASALFEIDRGSQKRTAQREHA